MRINIKHRERAEELKKEEDLEYKIKETIKVIACLVDKKQKKEIEKMYNKLFKGNKNDSTCRKIFRVFNR